MILEDRTHFCIQHLLSGGIAVKPAIYDHTAGRTGPQQGAIHNPDFRSGITVLGIHRTTSHYLIFSHFRRPRYPQNYLAATHNSSVANPSARYFIPPTFRPPLLDPDKLPRAKICAIS